MKKRHIAVLLLAWFFSQQLFAAVWMVASTDMNCASHAQSDCVVIVNPTAHMGHAMPMATGSDEANYQEKSPLNKNSLETNSLETNKAQNNLLTNCDHCSTVCQPLVLTNNLAPLIRTTHLQFNAQPTDAIVVTFLSKLFRPPILG